MTNGVYLHQACGETADSAAEAFYHLAICPLVRTSSVVERAAIDLDEDARRRLSHHRQRVEREEDLATTIRRA